MKKALIIGGSGFLGRHLVAELQDMGIDVFALQNKNAVFGIDSQRLIRGGLKAVKSGMIDDIKPDVIFHAARPVMPRLKKWGRILSARKAALLNRRLIINLAKSETKPMLVFASGSLMYGNSPVPHYENAPLNPISYARQYFRGELPIVHAALQGSYPVQLFRLPWLLGAGSWFGWFYLENIRNRKTIPQFGPGNIMMEIINVRDAVKLMVKIALEEKPVGIINIPSGGAISHEEFICSVSDFFDVKAVDYRLLYPGNMEKEVLEAFTSNILLGTKYPDLFRDFGYTTLEESLGALSNIHTQESRE